MIEPTREQEQTAERICEMNGGWAGCEVSPFKPGVLTVEVGGGGRYHVNRDGSYIDPDNRLHEPEEE